MGFPIKRKKKNREQQTAPEEYHPQEVAQPEFPEDGRSESVSSNYLSTMIAQKKRTLNEEQSNINKLREKMEEHVKEVEALQFIKTGDPTISIADLLEIIDDYRKNDADKSAAELLDDIEKSLIKSTIDGM